MEDTSVIPIEITDELKKSYIDYAMSVIVSRAIPDVRDGLKPVHRRILYAMNSMGLHYNKAYKKSARVVGEVLGKYHPHGDSSVYEAMVRLAQVFSMRYPLVDGQGNYGSIDGDSAAAMRYTETRLDRKSDFIIKDLDKNTVSYSLNFDESLKEPTVLPSQFPNLLVNGSSGIAVGMMTSMLPHNLNEVCNGIKFVLDNEEREIELKEIFDYIKGPDFPNGGVILGRDGIVQGYKTGQGKVKVRAKVEIEEVGKKNCIVITEMPYQVNKASLIMQMANLVKDKKISGITNIKDESSRKGTRIVIVLSRDADENIVLNHLYKHTNMQVTASMINLVLVDNKPKLLPILDLIKEFIKHRKDIIKKRTQYMLNKAQERAHLLDGLLIALDNIDLVVKLIKESDNVENAKNALMGNFDLDEIQAKAILDMKLQKLTSLEQDSIKSEHKELMQAIEDYKDLLSKEDRIRQVVKDETDEVQKLFGDKRRTQIDEDYEVIDSIDLIKKEEVLVTLTNKGYMKRVPLENYRVQNRKGRGVSASSTSDGEYIRDIVVTHTHATLLFFTTFGKVYSLETYQIPEFGRGAKGRHIANILNLDKDEEIARIISFDETVGDKDSFLFCTQKGLVKRTSFSLFKNIRKSGIIAINLHEEDSLVNVMPVNNNDLVLLATKSGMATRFKCEEVREMGRNTAGVIGIRLSIDDRVVNAVLANSGEIMTVTENGYSKKTKVEDYSVIHRGGKGVRNIKITPKNRYVVTILNVSNEDEVMVLSEQGHVIRISTERLSSLGRNTQGVILMRIDPTSDKVVAATKVFFIDGEETD